MSIQNYSLGQVGDYEIKQLKVFKTVVDCGGFSAAETALNIGRSTISLHISSLEARLNLILCKRGRAGFSLTEEGAVVYAMTEKLLDSLEGFRTTVNNLNSSLTGEMRVVLSDAVSLDPRSHLPALLKQFGGQAPEVKITIDVASMATIERLVLNDGADIGFIPYHRQLDGLNYIHLYSDRCRLYCSSDNPLARLPAAELTDELIDQFGTVHAGLKPHEGVDRQLSRLRLTATAYYYEVRLAMILTGNYIGFIPEAYAEPYVQQGAIQALAPDTRHYSLGVAAICKKTATPNKPRDLFLSIIREQFDCEAAAPY